jgi:predicted HTH transcriptional regulator
VVREHQEAYYQALEDAGSAGESTPFVEFMLEIITKSLNGYIKESKKSNQKSNQIILLLIKENNHIAINELSEKTKLSQSGVKKILKKLKDENRLIRVGSLKGGHWQIKS